MPRIKYSSPLRRNPYEMEAGGEPHHHHQQGSYHHQQDQLGGDATVVDVYDVASEIGKECEKIIDRYGADALTSLMPKVINALEMLENLASKNERENTLMQELEVKVAQLENDKLEKAEYRQKFEKELEAIEDQWRTESKDLLQLVGRLQEENRRLARDVSPGRHRRHQMASSSPPQSPTQDPGDVLQRLRDTLEKQRDEIKVKDRELQEKSRDVDNLRSQVERLNATSRELRRKHKSFQAQVRTLCDERADFLVQLQDQQRDLSALKQRLGLAQKENEDLAKYDPPLPSNKVIYDLDDPNRPRFTTEELKDILHERNELKARVSDLEDELETYRPKKLDTLQKLLPLMDKIENACDSILNASRSTSVDEGSSPPPEEDAPVQGPLPYEPDDAPWKKCSESGIRKFFRKLFSESSGSGGGGSGSSFPRRSLSTLSKMALSATNDPVVPV